jgi:hypothetical protein
MAAIGRKLVTSPESLMSLELWSHPEQASLALVQMVHGDQIAPRLAPSAWGEPQSAGILR